MAQTSTGFRSIQLIYSDAQGTAQNLSTHLKEWGMLNLGRNYRTLSIVGSQSTGKSTILNALFKTSFGVMNDADRKQTTKGIWLSRSDVGNILIMDVEGADGRERGEDKAFERKAALFALASSDVLIFNIWHTQVGLSDGANMGLFRTVLEVNFELFRASGSKILLFFLIRDHIERTPLSNLKQTLEKDVGRIWEGLPAARGRSFLDFFELQFAALPHKEYRPDAFESAVKDLRATFVDKNRKGYVFRPQFSKNVPVDGLSKYLEDIWEKVRTNKYLDISAQKESLAAYRCKSIADDVLIGFRTSSRLSSQLQGLKSGNLVEGLGKLMEQWRAEESTHYEKGALFYRDSNAFKVQLTELQKEINATLRTLFDLQIKNCRKILIRNFRETLPIGFKDPSRNRSDIVSTAKLMCEDAFKKTVHVSMPGDVEWSWESEFDSLRLELDSCVLQEQAGATQMELKATQEGLKATQEELERVREQNRDHGGPGLLDILAFASPIIFRDISRWKKALALL